MPKDISHEWLIAKQKVGREYFVKLGGIDVRVKVIDAEYRYGRIDYKVEPVGGGGAKWVQKNSLKPVKS